MNKNKNYRIKQINYGFDDFRYYPEKRFLGIFWIPIESYLEYFSDIKDCEVFLKRYIDFKNPSVDYFYYE